jgi:hypothetical protein
MQTPWGQGGFWLETLQAYAIKPSFLGPGFEDLKVVQAPDPLNMPLSPNPAVRRTLLRRGLSA